jgi:hypothetical protein
VEVWSNNEDLEDAGQVSTTGSVNKGRDQFSMFMSMSVATQEPDGDDDDDDGGGAAASDEWVDRVAAIARGAPFDSLLAVAAAIHDCRQRLQSCAASGKACAPPTATVRVGLGSIVRLFRCCLSFGDPLI